MCENEIITAEAEERNGYLNRMIEDDEWKRMMGGERTGSTGKPWATTIYHFLLNGNDFSEEIKKEHHA